MAAEYYGNDLVVSEHVWGWGRHCTQEAVVVEDAFLVTPYELEVAVAVTVVNGMILEEN